MPKTKLYVTMHTCKNGKVMPVLKFGDRFVTFDEVIISCMTGLSINVFNTITEDIVLAEI